MRILKPWLLCFALLAMALTLHPWARSEASVPTAQEFERVISNDGSFELRWNPEEVPQEFGERFVLTLEARRVDGTPFMASLSVDARMPEHGHGMNRWPLVKSLGGGRFTVQGMRFHMPGYWEIYFDFSRGAITERAQVSVDLE